MPTITAGQSGWVTEKDWIKHRALIEQFYKQQTLASVMDVMASQYGFRATFVFQTVLQITLSDAP